METRNVKNLEKFGAKKLNYDLVIKYHVPGGVVGELM